jgi:hypothetical protein
MTPRPEPSPHHDPARPPTPLRNDTKPGQCAAPDCNQTLPAATTGRPARYCSTACRVRAHRTRQHDQQQTTTVEIDYGSASSRGRAPDHAWMVRIRRGQRSVIVAIGLHRHTAITLAEKIADVLDTPKPQHPRPWPNPNQPTP